MTKKRKAALLRLPILLVILLTYCSPFYILLGISFKPATELTSHWKFSGNPTWENFQTAIEQGNIFTALKNTTLITVIVVLLIIAVSSLAAYPLARNKSRLNGVIKSFVLGIMMVPPLSILVPLYSILVDMGGINHYWGIIVILLTFELPQAIFLYTNFIGSIPTALDEAAAIDGCGPIRTFFTVYENEYDHSCDLFFLLTDNEQLTCGFCSGITGDSSSCNRLLIPSEVFHQRNGRQRN